MHTPYRKNSFIEREIEILARLHPTYTRRQLEECRENFVHYLDFVWKIYEQMRADGRAERILTDPVFNPTVNPPIPK